jgi:hypothetical protein
MPISKKKITKFDLNKIVSEEVIYRNGKSPVEIFIPLKTWLVKIITVDESGDLVCHNQEGKFLTASKLVSGFDLFFKKQLKTKVK